MNKIKKIIFTLICILLIPNIVSAADASISVTSSTTITLGNTVTVTVKLSGSALGSWEMDLNYDKSYLQLTSSTAYGGGTFMTDASSSTTGDSSKTYTFKFKTLKTGSTKVSVGSYAVWNVSQNTMSVSAGSKTITVKTQEEIEASYSKDNDLKSLVVDGYDLLPEFSSDVLEYSIDVAEDVKEVNVTATKNNSYASVSGDGVLAVTPGTNVFDILVRAQNGSEKTYKLTVNVIDKDPINVATLEGEKSVVKIKDSLEVPIYFTETTVKINELDIPAFYNEALDYTLVGLKDSTGTVELYVYNAEDNTYVLYEDIKFSNSIIIPIETDKTLEGYTIFKDTIGEKELDVYKVNKDSKFSIFYGKNVESGEEGFYKYDEESNTVIKYDDELITELNEKVSLYTYIIMVFSVILIILFIVIISLLKGKNKTRKKKNKSKSVLDDEDDD